jgi:hypothetical protein
MSSLPSLSDAKLPPAFHGRASHVSISRPAAPGGREPDKNESKLIERVREGDVQAFPPVFMLILGFALPLVPHRQESQPAPR